MKKFLSILLALAVGFTFTFGSAMSAFGATEYSLDDYNAALQAEKTAQQGYMASAKAKALNEFKYNENGFTSADLSGIATGGSDITGYSKAALEAAADVIIADAVAEMDAKINDILNKGSFPTNTAPDSAVQDIRNIGNAVEFTKGLTGTLAIVKDGEKVADVAQAPLTKAFVEGKLAVDFTKYNSTDKAYNPDGTSGDVLTAVEYINVLIDNAKKAIAEADKKEKAKDKLDEYVKAYNAFVGALNKVPTLADEEFNNGQLAGSIDAAINNYALFGIGKVDTAFHVDPKMAATDTVDWSATVKGTYKDFWKADKTVANKGKLFGVDVANITKVTRPEAVAVKNAIYTAINNSKAVVKVYAKEVKDVTDLHTATATMTDEEVFVNALNNAMNVADTYADVKALGEKYKKSYTYGIKEYDDAKVDAAVKKAEELVYADLGKTLKTPEEYIKAAAAALDIKIEAVNYEYQKFMAAVEDAAKKLYSDGLKATTPATKVLYGDNKTPEADYVYLKGTYDSKEGSKWDKIAKDTVDKLKDAQSYDEITAIMTAAATEFGKLLKADDAEAVGKAQTAYIASLNGYAAQVWAMLDQKKYDKATVDAANKAGIDLINEATSVDGVKAAFEEAKALIDKVKSKDELKAMKEAVEQKIAALPYTAKLTAADKATVREAYDALKEYLNTPGAAKLSDVAGNAVLKEKINKINALEATAIADEAKALKKKLDAVNGGSDADVAAFIAMKAEAEALVAKGDALKDEIKTMNTEDKIYTDITAVALGSEYDHIDGLLAKDTGNTFYERELNNAYSLLVQASKDGATTEQIKAALDAYNKLTDKQKYSTDNDIYALAKIVEGKLGLSDEAAKAYVQDLSIAVRTAKVGKKVKVTVKADVQTLIDNGYTVTYKFYKSTKKGSGYKNTVNKTTNTYTNTNPVKGKNYYKVKLVVKNADGAVVATTPLTQCKYGVRTIK